MALQTLRCRPTDAEVEAYKFNEADYWSPATLGEWQALGVGSEAIPHSYLSRFVVQVDGRWVRVVDGDYIVRYPDGRLEVFEPFEFRRRFVVQPPNGP